MVLDGVSSQQSGAPWSPFSSTENNMERQLHKEKVFFFAKTQGEGFQGNEQDKKY